MTKSEYERERMATWRAALTGLLADPCASSGCYEVADACLAAFDERFAPKTPAPVTDSDGWRPCSKEEALDLFLQNDCQVALGHGSEYTPLTVETMRMSTSLSSFRTKAPPCGTRDR